MSKDLRYISRRLAAICCIVALLCSAAWLWREGVFVKDGARFSPLRWKLAAPQHRRHLVKDLLARHQVDEMNVANVVALLGEPERDREHWVYHMSANGATPPGAQLASVFADYPQLYVRFRDGIVSAVFTDEMELPAQRDFDSSHWRASDWQGRQAFVQSLCESRILIEKSKPEVQALLGPSDVPPDNRMISYDLGWNLVDPVSLEFEIGIDGQVIDCKVVDG